jgi:predicted Zn-dependent protease
MHAAGRGHPKTFKPIFNPFSKGRNHSRNGRQGFPFHLNKQALLAITFILLSAATWYLTPASTFLARIILLCIPIHEDISLGIESWKQMNQNYPLVFRDRWGLKSIGNELANMLEMNRGVFCSKIAVVDVSQCMTQMKEYRWSFEIVSSPEINAFALPGGIVRVTDTLLHRLDLTKGEIAGLLGHEMGHVLFRHGQARLLKRNLLEMVLKALVYDDGDDRQESFGEAVGELLLNGAKFLGEMKFSRQDEYEADEAAFDILANSRMYDPRAVQSLLEKLWSLNDGSTHGRKGMLSFVQGWDKTHPGTPERIEALARRWSKLSSFEKNKFRGRIR